MKKLGDRKVIVAFADELLQKSLNKLKEGKFEDKELYELINRAFDDLHENPFIGIDIPRRLWPKEYIQKYNINNLSKYDLPNGWRLIYFVRGTKVEVVALILEWFPHKEYERRFGY